MHGRFPANGPKLARIFGFQPASQGPVAKVDATGTMAAAITTIRSTGPYARYHSNGASVRSPQRDCMVYDVLVRAVSTVSGPHDVCRNREDYS
jgi:hypothetical protein